MLATYVRLKIARLRERRVALVAFVRLFSAMRLSVISQVLESCEQLRTLITFIGLFASMRARMLCKAIGRWKSHFAHRAFVRFFLQCESFVYAHKDSASVRIVAHIPDTRTAFRQCELEQP